MATPTQTPGSESGIGPNETFPDNSTTSRYIWRPVPAEIELSIFERLTSLEEVWSLACTSQRFWRLFHTHGPRIIEAVLSNAQPYIRRIMHVIFNLRAGDRTPYTYEELQITDDYAPLRRDASEKVIREFVSLARKIHALAHVILDDCIDSFRGLADKLRPAAFDRDHPQLEHYLTKTWNTAEELRVIMGLWMCELHWMINYSAKHNMLPWTKALLDDLPPESRSVFDFFGQTWWGALVTIWTGLMAMKAPRDIRHRLYHSGELPQTFGLPRAPKGSFALGLRCDIQLPDYSNDNCQFREKYMLDVRMRQNPLMMNLFGGLRGIAPEEDELHYLPHEHYVRFGLLIWGNERLKAVGLLPVNYFDMERPFQCLRSLLADPVIAAIAGSQEQEKRLYWIEKRENRAQGIADSEPDDNSDFYESYGSESSSEATDSE
ncbi:hypothetical protein PWT90_01799 [Aphanocladium album]|nr:hypothetical protein PWT90_01799 [Aphanocladium album]